MILYTSIFLRSGSIPTLAGYLERQRDEVKLGNAAMRLQAARHPCGAFN